MIFKQLEDPQPHVVYGALHCIGILAEDFGPYMQLASHHFVVPALLQLLVHYPHPRIRRHAAAALCNFVASLTYYIQVSVKCVLKSFEWKLPPGSYTTNEMSLFHVRLTG